MLACAASALRPGVVTIHRRWHKMPVSAWYASQAAPGTLSLTVQLRSGKSAGGAATTHSTLQSSRMPGLGGAACQRQSERPCASRCMERTTLPCGTKKTRMRSQCQCSLELTLVLRSLRIALGRPSALDPSSLNGSEMSWLAGAPCQRKSITPGSAGSMAITTVPSLRKKRSMRRRQLSTLEAALTSPRQVSRSTRSGNHTMASLGTLTCSTTLLPGMTIRPVLALPLT